MMRIVQTFTAPVNKVVVLLECVKMFIVHTSKPFYYVLLMNTKHTWNN